MAKKELSSEEITLDDGKADLSKVAEGKSALVDEIVVPTDDLGKFVRDEAFMADILDVQLSDPKDEDDFQFCTIGVNGRMRTFRRDSNTIHQMPRSFVEVLARSKVTRVKTVRKVLPDGSETMEPQVTYTQVYPFSVIADPRGKAGFEWLRRVMNQSA